MKEYEKHPLNFTPDPSPNNKDIGLDLLENDLIKYGYNSHFPIYLYQGKIIDGWVRYLVCKREGIEPVFEEFPEEDYTPEEMTKFKLQTIRGRNLPTGQLRELNRLAKEMKNNL